MKIVLSGSEYVEIETQHGLFHVFHCDGGGLKIMRAGTGKVQVEGDGVNRTVAQEVVVQAIGC